MAEFSEGLGLNLAYPFPGYLKLFSLTKADKKMESGQIKFVLLKKVGKAVIDKTVTDGELLEAVREIYFSDEDAKA